MSKDMRPYSFGVGEPGTAAYLSSGPYESDPDQCRKETATVWALHLNVPAMHVDAVLDRLSRYRDVTGEYLLENDSFIEWGEPSTDQSVDNHLVVYFRGPNLRMEPGVQRRLKVVHSIATLMAMAAGMATTPEIGDEFAVSTAGDHAEQIY